LDGPAVTGASTDDGSEYTVFWAAYPAAVSGVLPSPARSWSVSARIADQDGAA
jgi:hypothetical protein